MRKIQDYHGLDAIPELGGYSGPVDDSECCLTRDTLDLLVIDDDETEKRLFEIYLMDMREQAVACRFAMTIEKGVEMIMASKPDIIFLDNRVLPYENFTQTMPKIRAAGFEGPVVVMSASLYDPVFDEASRHGVSGCVDKLDLSGSTLKELVARHLS